MSAGSEHGKARTRSRRTEGARGPKGSPGRGARSTLTRRVAIAPRSPGRAINPAKQQFDGFPACAERGSGTRSGGARRTLRKRRTRREQGHLLPYSRRAPIQEGLHLHLGAVRGRPDGTDHGAGHRSIGRRPAVRRSAERWPPSQRRFRRFELGLDLESVTSSSSGTLGHRARRRPRPPRPAPRPPRASPRRNKRRAARQPGQRVSCRSPGSTPGSPPSSGWGSWARASSCAGGSLPRVEADGRPGPAFGCWTPDRDQCPRRRTRADRRRRAPGPGDGAAAAGAASRPLPGDRAPVGRSLTGPATSGSRSCSPCAPAAVRWSTRRPTWRRPWSATQRGGDSRCRGASPSGRVLRGYVAYQRRLLPMLRAAREMVITVSEFSRGELVELLGVPPERIAVIPEGVEERFRPRWTRARPAGRWPGRGRTCSPSARPPRARTSARSSRPPGRLRTRGNRTGRRRLNRGYLRGARGEPAAAGLRRRAAPARAVRRCAGVAMPSLYEGFGLPCLEAMAERRAGCGRSRRRAARDGRRCRLAGRPERSRGAGQGDHRPPPTDETARARLIASGLRPRWQVLVGPQRRRQTPPLQP